jgi:metal-responsive CopG/Arc/MetJ family transcriptional regulator
MRKGEVVSITMSPAMKTLLDVMAGREGLNRSQYIRKLLTEEIKKLGLVEDV